MNGIFNEEGLVSKKSLNEEELKGIKDLEISCNKYENLTMRLNWRTMKTRSQDEENDFLYFEDGMLVGYLGMYSFNNYSTELSGMVHPDYRNKGIFTKLFSRARQECKQRQMTKMILICEKSSVPGKQYLRSVGANLYSTEYKMELNKKNMPMADKHNINLRIAKLEDWPIRASIIKQCFDFEMSEEVFIKDLNNKDQYGYVCEVEGKVIGNISASRISGNINIYGIGIFRDYRSNGFGRQMLSLFLKELVKEKVENIFLEVESRNSNALNLYKSCGFSEVTAYDYYEIIL